MSERKVRELIHKYALLLHYILSLFPLAWVALLYAFAFAAAHRAQLLLGHWPRVMLDDPKNICGNDVVYGWWVDGAFLTLLPGFLLLLTSVGGWGALMAATWQRTSRGYKILLTCLYATAWIICFITMSMDPSSRLEWLMD